MDHGPYYVLPSIPSSTCVLWSRCGRKLPLNLVAAMERSLSRMARVYIFALISFWSAVEVVCPPPTYSKCSQNGLHNAAILETPSNATQSFGIRARTNTSAHADGEVIVVHVKGDPQGIWSPNSRPLTDELLCLCQVNPRKQRPHSKVTNKLRDGWWSWTSI